MTAKVIDIQDLRLDRFARENGYRDFAAWQEAMPDETDEELDAWFRANGMDLADPNTWQYADSGETQGSPP